MFLDQLADNAETYLNGSVRVEPITAKSIPVYVNEDGTDLQQLIQKFLLVSITYSQSAGDYLGEDYQGKGLTTDNISTIRYKEKKKKTTSTLWMWSAIGVVALLLAYMSYKMISEMEKDK